MRYKITYEITCEESFDVSALRDVARRGVQAVREDIKRTHEQVPGLAVELTSVAIESYEWKQLGV